MALIRRYAPTKDILGVCLGHQALCEAFGATLINLSEVHHGLSEPVEVLVPVVPVAAHAESTSANGARTATNFFTNISFVLLINAHIVPQITHHLI